MSRNCCRLLFASLALAVIGTWAASFASAADEPANPPPRQRGQGGRNGGGDLTQNPKVQDDLKLTDDQKDSIKKANADFRSSLTGLSQEDRRSKMQDMTKALQDKIGGILDDKQKARLKEIRLQVRGTAALADKEVAESLKLTDDQVSKIKDINDSMRKDMQSARGDGGGDRAAAREKMTALRKDTTDKIMAVLTSEQKEQFEKMQGTKIEGLPQGGGLGFGLGAGGRRNRNNPDATPKTDSTKPADAKPADAKPADSKPADSKPADSK